MIRAKVVAEHARLIAAAGITGRARVSALYPGEKQLTAEEVFCTGTDGGLSVPYAMPGERIQRDQFTALWVVRVTNTRTVADAVERRDELAAEVVRHLADTASDLLSFTADGEEVTDGLYEGQAVAVTTREGDDPKTGRPIAVAEITVPYETQTINEEG